MPPRIAALVLTMTGCLCFASALPTVTGPTEDPRDCPTPKKGELIVKFPGASPETQKLVLDFRVEDKLPCNDVTRWGYTVDGGPPKIGQEDKRKPAEHFKNLDHPRVQPRPGDSTWRTYCLVPNLTDEDQERWAVPKVDRPRDEKWLNCPRPKDAPIPADCPSFTGHKFRFESLPTIDPPKTIRTTYVQTAEGIFPPYDPFLHPPGTNMLPTVYSDVFDGDSKQVPNSLPSSVTKVYNLHDGDPVVTPINPRSPTNDLQEVLDTTYTLLTGSSPQRLWERLDRQRYEDALCDLSKNRAEILANRPRIRRYLRMGLDIIEGKPVADRVYGGLPLLHHSGQTRVRRIVPRLASAPYSHPENVGPLPWPPNDGSPPAPAAKEGPQPPSVNVVGGNAQVHQVWYDGRIESDTMYLDWTGEYDGCKVLVLKAGQDDSALPKVPSGLLVISTVGGQRHYRLFDRRGHKVVDGDESSFHPTVEQAKAVTEQLDQLILDPDPKPNHQRRAFILAAVAPILKNPFASQCAEELKLPPIPPNVPWTVTYTVDVLDRGRDDFATTTMFFDSHNATETYYSNKGGGKDDPARKRQFQTLVEQSATKGATKKQTPPHPQLTLVSMDQTFFPMESGTRTVITIKMPPPEYHNLTYTWGWRFHPPRAQAMEDAAKRRFDDPTRSVVEYEREAFGDDPTKAVNRLGDVAPAKRMWRAFDLVLKHLDAIEPTPSSVDKDPLFDCLTQLLDARSAFLEWKDRNHLPSGLMPDPASDLTVLFVNNTTYGQIKEGGWTDLPEWRVRDHPVKVTLINADYFPHQYLNVEWGGNRGWEPQFKPTLKNAGSGTFFSFGRFHYQYNTVPGTIEVPAARRYRKSGSEINRGDEDEHMVPFRVEPGVHRLWINMRHEPSRRLRFYQFDPTHHDVAIYSIH